MVIARLGVLRAEVAATGARGTIAFGRLDVADLDPLRFAVER